jgi:uncharacterized protein YcbX
MTARVAWIHVAPVKGLAIEERGEIVLERYGAHDNRRFYVVNDEGAMTNSKKLGALGRVRSQWDEESDSLALRFPDGRTISGTVALGAPHTSSFYGRPVAGRIVEGPWADALSEFTGRSLRLVRSDEPGAALDRSGNGGISLLSAAALDALQRAAGVDEPVDPRRFRMLFGVAGVSAHEEDMWIGKRVEIGDALVEVKGNVGRCVITKQNPKTAERDLDTLGAIMAYRGECDTTEPIPFGVWGCVLRPGRVRLGDSLRAL